MSTAPSSSSALFPSASGQRHQQLDVLARAEIGQEITRGLLPDETDLLAPVGRQLGLVEHEQILAVDLQPPG
jgi:hypothetical protein